MSVPRVLAPLTSSTSFVFRFASSPATSSLRPCQHVLRSFSSKNSSRMSSKRKMQTSTAYQPYPLDTQPPPPRNAGIPDTSIAGGIPQFNDTRPPKQTGQHEVGIESPAEQKSSISVTEQEAQTSKPVVPAAQPRAKPRPKLRARKAAMNLTPGAVNQLRAMLNQPDPKLIKVGVKNRGCSGLAYHLEYVEKPGTFDETVEQDGVKVLIDSKALFSIIGSEMDWVEDKLNQRFVFRNPNIKEQCGCGESFMV
ncbi:Iron-sulfur assembly protein [Lachnellula subtilissima]|uniref:Iron-sulfur assembly protein 1 n=1 Tax=Lachnellula subtilissima TaxID=602034 RepID=A0A8H8UH10_9HELO|nr:Iron-sulfur assembly protein [Lachnellula subtilissima]